MARSGAGRGFPSGLSAVAHAGTGIPAAAGFPVRTALALAWTACGLACGITACSAATAARTAGGSCGTVRTGAGVPVAIRIVRGPVDCAVALRVERAYAAMIRDGGIQGNGGGAPLLVTGWTCQGYPEPRVLRTGYASECHTASVEVAAVLAVSLAGT